MLICFDCGETFDSPNVKRLLLDVNGLGNCYEDYATCPHCDSDAFGEAERCPMCDEYVAEEDMIDLSDSDTFIDDEFTRVCEECYKDAGGVL